MARLSEKVSVEVVDGYFVSMTQKQKKFWTTLTAVPAGSEVTFETFEEELNVSRNNLRVVKSAVADAVSDVKRIVATRDGYKLVDITPVEES